MVDKQFAKEFCDTVRQYAPSGIRGGHLAKILIRNWSLTGELQFNLETAEYSSGETYLPTINLTAKQKLYLNICYQLEQAGFIITL